MIPLEERPRERLLSEGSEALSNRELLAILLGSALAGKNVLDLSDELLMTFGGLSGLMEASVSTLTKIRGVGSAKALQIVAAMTLAKRILRVKPESSETISDSKQAFQWCRDLFFGAKKEMLVLLLLNANLSLIRREVLSLGTLTEVLIHPREVFHTAIKHSAHSLILAHNHPSGELTPSKMDLELTEKIRKAGILLGIPILDHLIIANDQYYSLLGR